MLKELSERSAVRLLEKLSKAVVKEYMSQCTLTPLTKGQKNDIQSYYKRMMGQSVPTLWHEYYYSRNGMFSVRYLPTSVYQSQIVWCLNDYAYSQAYVDKGFYDVVFEGVNRPRTIVKNINGHFYDEKKWIERETAVELCQDIPRGVIKPTVGGMHGCDVRVLTMKDGMTDGGDSVAQLFSQYQKNFIIQEYVQQHEGMAQLNPTSLNTIRVLTYRDGSSIYTMYAIARIGRMGGQIDNLTSGGIFADIDIQTGTIEKCAYGAPGENRIETTDCGTRLEGFRMPSFDRVLSLAKELHTRLPYFDLVGWDMAVDAQGEPLLIEWNRAPDIYSQTAHGPAFGDMTDELLARIRHLPNTRYTKCFRKMKIEK